MTRPVVGVVIVAKDTRDAALRCLASVRADASSGAFDVRTVLVDNASSDGTAEAVRARFGSWADVVANPENTGFGAACNQGAARFPAAHHLLFLNADAELAPGALAALVGELEADARAGAAGPRMVGADDAPQPSVRGHPTPLALLHQHTALRFLRVGSAAYARYKRPAVRGDAPSDVPVVMGACLLVRGDVFRSLGGFDSRYFLYFEEADLCRRLADDGRTVRFVPAALVRHAGGASADRDRERALTWYLASLFAYVDRFHGRGTGLLYRAAFKPLFLVRLATDAVRDALALLVRGRSGKRDELALTGRFLVRGMWTFLVS